MMDDSIHILLIEDDPAHAELIQRVFEDRGNGAHLAIANTLNEARTYLQNFRPTLIIADWRLPDGDSTTFLEEADKRILQEQERIQLTLAEREAQFRLLAENSSDMISRHNTEGTFLYVSPACRTLMGYEPEELIGKGVLPFVHTEDAEYLLKLLSSS